MAADRVGWIERVPPAVAVAVDAFTEPGAGQELREPLRAGRADGSGIPAGLRLELGSQQRGGDPGAGLGGLLHQRLIRSRDGPGPQPAGRSHICRGARRARAAKDQHQQNHEHDRHGHHRRQQPTQRG